MYIRSAGKDDLDTIMNIYKTAQDFMIESGNPTQWGHSYPQKELIKKDIANGVCNDERSARSICTFQRRRTYLPEYRKW